jgi:hypothetical protein
MSWGNRNDTAVGIEGATDMLRAPQRPARGDNEVVDNLFNALREQHQMALTLRERLKVLKNKLGISSSRGEAPEPGKIEGIPLGGLANFNNNVLRESLTFIEEIDSFIGG